MDDEPIGAPPAMKDLSVFMEPPQSNNNNNKQGPASGNSAGSTSTKGAEGSKQAPTAAGDEDEFDFL